jgi:hypothetical protein
VPLAGAYSNPRVQDEVAELYELVKQAPGDHKTSG